MTDDYGLLKAFGFSPFKATEIRLDAQRAARNGRINDDALIAVAQARRCIYNEAAHDCLTAVGYVHTREAIGTTVEHDLYASADHCIVITATRAHVAHF